MNVAIVAGNPVFHRHLQKELRQHCFSADFRSFYTADMFFRILKYRKFDLVFLDEDIPDQDGLTVSRKLRERNAGCLVVFVTDRLEIIQKAFGTNVMAFIPGQQFDAQVPELIRKIRDELSRKRQIILRTVQNRALRLSASEILYADFCQRHVAVHTDQGQFELKRAALKEVYDRLPPNCFVYISRSCFVNLSRIRTVSGKKLYLEHINEPFLISRGRCQDLKKQLLCL